VTVPTSRTVPSEHSLFQKRSGRNLVVNAIEKSSCALDSCGLGSATAALNASIGDRVVVVLAVVPAVVLAVRCVVLMAS